MKINLLPHTPFLRYDGKFDLPGGSIEFGETPLEGLTEYGFVINGWK